MDAKMKEDSVKRAYVNYLIHHYHQLAYYYRLDQEYTLDRLR
jgi:hypothetical protein